MRYPILVPLATALAAFLTGCASVTSDLNEVKADVVTPAPDAGFIQDPERETKRADLPFQKVWVESGVDLKHYRELIVAPVNTQHMLKMDWLHKMSGRMARQCQRRHQRAGPVFSRPGGERLPTGPPSPLPGHR